MPYPNEHAARLRNPDDFQEDSFRRKEIAPGVTLILGRLIGETALTPQAYRFDKDKFTPAEAKAWLKDHDEKAVSFEAAAGDDAKFGARHNRRDKEIITGWRKRADELRDDMDELGAEVESAPAAAKGADIPPLEDADMDFPMASIKAVGDMELEIRVGYGRDSHGQYFSARTDYDVEHFPTPPVAYYHGYGMDGKPLPKPIFIGSTYKRETRADGHYLFARLDKSKPEAHKVFKAALSGAPASPGTIYYMRRIDKDGHLAYWPIAEISVWEDWARRPANMGTMAVSVLKALYSDAGLAFPKLDEGAETSQADATGEQQSAAAAKSAESGTTQQGARDMTPEELKALLDARDAEHAAAAKAAADRAAEIETAKTAAVTAAKAQWEQEAAKGRRLGITAGQPPYAAKFADTWKFDNLDPADNALMIALLGDAHKRGLSNGGVTDAAMKALVLKLNGAKDDEYAVAKSAMKAAGIDAAKANELNYSTQAGYGDEWVGVAYSTRLWEAIRQETFVADRLMARAIEVPPGFESITLPLEGADMTWYKVAQATANNATTGIPDATVTASKTATANKSLTLAKMGARNVWAGEMEEDSLIPFMAQVRMQLVRGGGENVEHVCIDGDTETAATTNINSIGGTPGGTETYMLLNGFRKSCLVTTTANSRSGGALAAEDFLETVKLMGLAGRNALNKSETSFIIDLWTAWKSLELPEVKTRDVFAQPTIENGALTGIYGYKINPSAFMHWANTDSTYGLKANSAGKVDLTTAANNLYGAILAVRWDQWQFGIRRRMSIETQRIPQADATQIVAFMRFGLVQRDTEASAITYGVVV